MKKVFSIFVGLFLIVTLVGCTPASDNKAFRSTTTNLIETNGDKTLTTVYYRGNQQIPYVDVVSFLNALDNHIDKSVATTKSLNQLFISFQKETVLYTLNIDFDTDIVMFNDWNFIKEIVPTTPGTSDDFNISLVDSKIVAPGDKQVVINFSLYNFDFVIQKVDGQDRYLMPLVIADRLFTGADYDSYFNGTDIRIFPSFFYTSYSSAVVNFRNTSKAHSKRSNIAFREASFNYFMFYLDYFYGLSQFSEESALQVFSQFKADFAASDEKMHFAYSKIVAQLDDAHTGIVNYGYHFAKYAKAPQLNSLLIPSGPRIKSMENSMLLATTGNPQNAPTTWFEKDLWGNILPLDDESVVQMHVIDKTAYIFISEFALYEKTIAEEKTTFSTADLVAEKLDTLATNPDYLTVEKVVLDLAYNGGGYLDGTIELLLLMTDENISYRTTDPVSKQVIENTYEQKNPKTYNYDFSILTSPMSYSAANLFASIAKDLNLAQVIGAKSTGGASAVDTFVGLDGTVMSISGNFHLVNLLNESIEYGVSPDFLIPEFWNLEKITSLIQA